MKKIMTTRNKIKDYLLNGKKLNSLTAFEKFNTLSLQQHIHALRQQGIDIKTEEKTNKKTHKRFAEYFI